MGRTGISRAATGWHGIELTQKRSKVASARAIVQAPATVFSDGEADLLRAIADNFKIG
jgi:hypothetical protein